MHFFYLLAVTVLSALYFESTLAYPAPAEEDYATYAQLYPEIAKKIGEEPIEIIDVVKSIVVYDSDDVEASQAPPDENEPVNPPEGETETFQR